MQPIESPDSHHLSAALGWLGLGAVNDARAELARVSDANRDHPATLEVRWMLYTHEKDWSMALDTALIEIAVAPNDCAGWLHRAYALRRVTDGGLSQAWDALLPAAEKFPDEPVIAFNLACYACQMQQLDLARRWLRRAFAAGDKGAVKKMALADDDLQALWAEIEKM